MILKVIDHIRANKVLDAMFQFLLAFVIALIILPLAHADNSKKGKKVIYKSHTQVDFSGEAVQGKIRAPEVFYIFQRKRSNDHEVDMVPDHLGHHGPSIRQTMEVQFE